LALGSINAEAASVTFTLNCTFTGPGNSGACGSPTGPFGTVTLTDSATNSNWIDISVNMAQGYAKFLYLNYSGSAPSGGYGWGGSNISQFSYGSNGYGPGVYDYLDLGLDPSGSGNPWTGTLFIKKSSQNLYQNIDVSMFNLLSNDPQLSTPVYAGVTNVTGQVCTFEIRGVCLKWSDVEQYVGAVAPPQTAPVPEPSTLVILGAGLLVAARRLRRRT
jgi:hypothetical protein